ncbi:hypothetical protein [Streptomyces dubilierae]|uniref:Uncharacterized protein n=1 Tax=Streptomyces dubilierae TaxID=3075533 RepID=A0ABU2P6Y5_9ACTN|nr:hypothetical protein [Streptomyces sp. DSM 41921]MDT0387909.1 hypothetical protein [Streptomyces sp. DSM 41921]
MSEPVAVELTDGLNDTTNVTVSIARSVLAKLNQTDTWTGRDAEVSISGEEVPIGRVTINIFEG